MKKSKDLLDSDQIDIISLIEPLWIKRVLIVKMTALFFILGLFIAIYTQKEFRAFSMFIPQTSETNGMTGGSLGGLASLAGINVGSSNASNGIPPDLYPQIAASVSFRTALINSKLTVEGLSNQVTYAEYYKKHAKTSVLGTIRQYTVGLPTLLLSALMGQGEQSNNVNTRNESIRVSNFR